MNPDFEDPSLWLEAEYLSRRRKNPAYSLRAFARLLEIPSGRLSQLLSRKRRFTRKLGEKIAGQLSCDPQRTQDFLDCIHRARAQGKFKSEGNFPDESMRKYTTLDLDVFQSIADPIHFALLSLVETEGFRSDPGYLARRLGVSRLEARCAADRLVRLGLLIRRNNASLALAQSPGLATTHDIPSAALRESHRKILEHAIQSLEEIPVDKRDYSSIAMAIDPRKLPEAKAKLRAFRRGMSEFLESGAKTEVYRLNIQLVPVTKKGKKQ